jgi:zinc/manganese transport system permease protein
MLQLLFLPFVACLVIAGIHCYLGLHVLRRGIIFVDLALAQVAALGATIGLLLGHDLHGPQAQALSLALTIAGAALFATLRLKGEELSQEAFIGIVYAVASAAAILVLDAAKGGQEEVKNMLVGSILFVTGRDVLRLAVIYVAVGLLHVAFRKRFDAISSDPEGARAQGVRVVAWDFLFYLTFGLVITQSVRIAGVLLVFSFLIVPAACASVLTKSLRARLPVGWGIALIGSLGGLWLSARWDLPTGAAVVTALGGGPAREAAAAAPERLIARRDGSRTRAAARIRRRSCR